jgi:RimJ/RimL family protein N-acetyltransferase
LVARYALWEARQSPDGRELWLNWAAKLREPGEYVGWFQSTVRRGGQAEIAYMIFAPYRRHGYATEAARAMIDYLSRRHRVATIWITVDRRNAASLAVGHSLGFCRREESGDEIRLSLAATRH